MLPEATRTCPDGLLRLFAGRDYLSPDSRGFVPFVWFVRAVPFAVFVIGDDKETDNAIDNGRRVVEKGSRRVPPGSSTIYGTPGPAGAP